MKLIQLNRKFLILVAIALLQACNGAPNEAKLESTANIDSNNLSSGNTIIAQAVSGTGVFEIPIDQVPVVVDPNTGAGIPQDPAVVGTSPVVVVDPIPPVVVADPIPPVVITPPVGLPDEDDGMCVSKNDDDDSSDDDDHKHKSPHDNGKHNGFSKNAKHHGYGKYEKSKKHENKKHDGDDDSSDDDNSKNSCNDDDASKYCDSKYIAKHHKKGSHGYAFKFVTSADLKFENTRGKLIIVGTNQHSFVSLVNGHRGKLIFCGVRVQDVKNTRGKIRLYNAEIADLTAHKGHLELDRNSRVLRINASRMSVHKK